MIGWPSQRPGFGGYQPPPQHNIDPKYAAPTPPGWRGQPQPPQPGPYGPPGGQPGYPQPPASGPPAAPQANVQTSIQPQPLFSQDYTQRAGNMAAAMAVPARADVMNRAATPGVSMSSPMTQHSAGWQYGQGLGQAAMAPQQIGMQHGFANLQNMLQGQVGREQEAMGWAGLGLGNQQALNQYNQGLQGGLLGLLGNSQRWWGG